MCKRMHLHKVVAKKGQQTCLQLPTVAPFDDKNEKGRDRDRKIKMQICMQSPRLVVYNIIWPGCCQQNNLLFVILVTQRLLTGSGCGSLHPLLEDAVVMAFLVLDQMIGAYEASCTNGTGEFFLASVHPTMAGKFI